MSGRKHIFIILAVTVSVSLTASALTALFLFRYYSRLQFDMADDICREVLEQDPNVQPVLSAALKEYTVSGQDSSMNSSLLTAWGYRESDFSGTVSRWHLAAAAAGVLSGIFLFACTFLYRNRTESARIQALTNDLEKINMGKAAFLSVHGEDVFSRLEDEIYKTVTFLYQTKDAAVTAKKDFADNLSNIAHQIKTPITAISLSVQTMKQERDNPYTKQIQKQLRRLTRLEESLLLLSRLDAGVLPLHKEEIDVFTVLTLAADELQELFAQSGTSIRIPELGQMAVTADWDWTIEIFINLMKNCGEHNTGGIVHCFYSQNPMYTEILIWDEGKGFDQEDIPHLFERFYRGKNAREGGIGIGLALAKEMMERQNGTLRAGNMPGGGACFEIRFYSC